MNIKKSSMTSLLKILEEHSDENNPLTMADIISLLDIEYGIELERRTVYRNIDSLIELGYDISDYSENGKGYYLRGRLLEQSEIFLLCNAIHSSNYIPSKASRDLIERLLSTQSKRFREDYRDTVYVENTSKKENPEFFLNIEMISEAIRKRKSVSFDYVEYDLNRKLVKRQKEKYEYSPYLIVYADEKTYLVARSNRHPDRGLTHFRLDKIKNVEFSNMDYIRRTKKEDPYSYAKNRIYMYSGEEEKVELLCDNMILNDVIDKFGKEVRIEKVNDECFKATVRSSGKGIIYYALQYLDHMEVLEPQSLRDEVRKTLKSGIKKYK